MLLVIDINEIKKDEKYFIISINYEKENGIRFYEDFEKFLQEFDETYYKIYIFNENRMYEFINNDGEIIKNYVSNEDVLEKYDRFVYIDIPEKKYSKIKITNIITMDNKKDYYFSGMEV